MTRQMRAAAQSTDAGAVVSSTTVRAIGEVEGGEAGTANGRTRRALYGRVRLPSCRGLSAIPDADRRAPRIAVIIPCHGEGRLIAETVASIEEPEPVHIVVVDDVVARRGDPADPLRARGGGTDGAAARARTAASGERACTRSRRRRRATSSRSTPTTWPSRVCCRGWPTGSTPTPAPSPAWATSSSSATPSWSARCPLWLDPYRVAYTNEYPISALFRRDALEEIGGWYRAWTAQQGYEDWNLWMAFAEQRSRIVHLGPGVIGYRRRLHGSRLNAEAKRRHAEIYSVMRDGSP